MRSFVSDLRHAVRALIKVPGFTVVATLVLALGIGLNTAIFSLIDQLLLRPLPGDSEPGHLVGLYSYDTTRPNAYRDVSYPNYLDIRDRNEAFIDLAAYTVAFVGLGEGELTRQQMAFFVTSEFFTTFGVHPAFGRGFLPEEEVPGAARPVVVLSEEYWRKLGGDPGIIGETLRINARLFTVAGVMPRGFGGPAALISPAVWLPTGSYDVLVNDGSEGRNAKLGDRENHALMLAGRLKPGLSPASADPMLKALGASMREEFPGAFRDHSLEARPLSRMNISTAPQDDSEAILPAALLQAMAAVVLLIACMNLANMMLARGSARRREVAIRLSLGAGRARIVRQLLSEGFVLSLAGGAAGLVLTFWALSLFGNSIDPMVPLVLTVDPLPDVRLLAVTFGFSVLATLAFGLGPALRLSRTNVVAQIKEGDTSAPERGLAGLGLRHALVVGQIALSLALLTAAGLFTRGAFQVSKADPGFSLERGLLVSFDPGLAGIDETRGREFYRRLVERVRQLPGVEAASLASVVPFGNITEGRRVRRVGEEAGGGRPRDDVGGISSSYGAGNSAPADNEFGAGTIYYVVGRDYFQALGLPIVRGRGFSDLEEQSADGPRVAVIDETLARRLFEDADPLGQHIYFPDRDPAERQPREVVGVVAGTRHSLFDRTPTPHVYVPFGHHYRSSMNLHLRPGPGGAAAEAAMLQLVRREVRAIDERVPILAEMTLREHRDSSMSAWLVRAGANTFTLFGGAAVLLALVGVYGVRAYLVSRRTREIGIRMALGATVWDIVWLVLREGMLLVGIGLAIGVGLAIGTGWLVAAMLYDVSAFDPVVFSLAPLLLALSALVACVVPARRAARIAPSTALRVE